MNQLEQKLFNALLTKPEVRFVYIKSNGLLRYARGTCLLSAIPPEKHPISSTPRPITTAIRYYDYNRRDWRSFTLGSIRSIAEDSKIYRLFISHSWSYSNEYERLVDLLDDYADFFWQDYSVPRNNPIHNAPNSQALTEAIRAQMRPVNCVLIMAGVYSTYSPWINKEITLAKEMGKPIVAIEGFGAERTSQIVKDNADEIVRWNSTSIVKAIRNNSKEVGF